MSINSMIVCMNINNWQGFTDTQITLGTVEEWNLPCCVLSETSFEFP